MTRCIILTFLLIATASAFGGTVHNREDRIIGGSDITIQQIPYIVTLQYNGTFYCAGTIITKNRILTSASCVQGVDISLLSIRAGSSNYNSGGQVFGVRSASIHPKFDVFDYDVAVLFLARNMTLSSTVRPAKIQLSGEEVESGYRAIIFGWGYTTTNNLVPNPVSENLKGAVVSIVDHQECLDAYNGYYTVTDRMICAAAEGKDACFRDNGGPMLNQVGVVIGIISWNYRCASSKYPGVYTKISNPELNTFIQNNLN